MCQGILIGDKIIRVVNWEVSSEDELDDLMETLDGCRGAFYTEGEWVEHSVHQGGTPPLVDLDLNITYFCHGNFKSVRASVLFVDEENGCALFLVMWDADDIEKQLETILGEYPTSATIYTPTERVAKATQGRAVFLKDVPADRHCGQRWGAMRKCLFVTLEEEEDS